VRAAALRGFSDGIEAAAAPSAVGYVFMHSEAVKGHQGIFSPARQSRVCNGSSAELALHKDQLLFHHVHAGQFPASVQVGDDHQGITPHAIDKGPGQRVGLDAWG